MQSAHILETFGDAIVWPLEYASEKLKVGEIESHLHVAEVLHSLRIR